jgi:hypothetical protein
MQLRPGQVSLQTQTSEGSQQIRQSPAEDRDTCLRTVSRARGSQRHWNTRLPKVGRHHFSAKATPPVRGLPIPKLF